MMDKSIYRKALEDLQNGEAPYKLELPERRLSILLELDASGADAETYGTALAAIDAEILAYETAEFFYDKFLTYNYGAY